MRRLERLRERRSGRGTRLTRPSRCASERVDARPSSRSSRASPRRIRCGRRCVPPAPGISPSRTSGQPSRAAGSATMRSHVSATSSPPPIALACTAATTGWGSAQEPVERAAGERDVVLDRAVSGEQALELRQVGSRHEGLVAEPVRTTARVPGSPPSSAAASASASSTPSASELTGGLENGDDRDAVRGLDTRPGCSSRLAVVAQPATGLATEVTRVHQGAHELRHQEVVAVVAGRGCRRRARPCRDR